MEEKRNVHRLLVGKPQEKRLIGRQRRRWIDNIKVDLAEMGWDGLAWTDLTQDRYRWIALVCAVLNLRVP
jgi:hypothetical protein